MRHRCCAEAWQLFACPMDAYNLRLFQQEQIDIMNLQYTRRWLCQAARLSENRHRVIGTITRPFRNSRFLYHAVCKCRRFMLAHFRKGYIEQQLSVRRGSCRQCGTCCNLLITCPRLTKQSNCLAYGVCRPEVCKIFPIDQRDIEEVALCGGKCGFYFPQPLSRPAPSQSSNTW